MEAFVSKLSCVSHVCYSFLDQYYERFITLYSNCNILYRVVLLRKATVLVWFGNNTTVSTCICLMLVELYL